MQTIEKIKKTVKDNRKLLYSISRNITMFFLLTTFLDFLNFFTVYQYLNIKWFFLLVLFFDFFAAIFYLRYEENTKNFRNTLKYLFTFFIFLIFVSSSRISIDVSLCLFLVMLLLGILFLDKKHHSRYAVERISEGFEFKNIIKELLNSPLSTFVLIFSYFLFLHLNTGLIFGYLGLEIFVDFFGVLKNFGSPGILFIPAIVIFICLLLYRIKINLPIIRKEIRNPISKHLRKLSNLNLLIMALIFILAFLVRFKSIDSTLYVADSFYMPLVAVNAVKNGILHLSLNYIFPALELNLQFPTGVVYYHGILYSILLSFSLKFFGFTDFALRFPGILFGSLGAVFTYLIGSKVFERKAGIIAAIIIAFSGWSVTFSTFLRNYSIYVPLFLITLFVFMKYLEKRNSTYFSLFLIALALLIHAHEQAFVVSIFLLFSFVISHFKNEEKITRILNLALILFAGLFIFLNPINQSRTILFQFAHYHIAYISPLIALSFIGSLFLINSSKGRYLNIIFYSLLISLPFMINYIGRVLRPRYTAILYPLFIIFLAVLVSKTLHTFYYKSGLNKKIDKKVFVFFLICLSLVVFSLSNSFILPFTEYSREGQDRGGIWPTKYVDGNWEDPPPRFRSTVVYKKYLPNFLNDKTGRVAIISPDPTSLYWYTKINENTKNNLVIPISIFTENWCGVKNSTYTRINIKEVKTQEDLETIKKKYKHGLIVINEAEVGYRINNKMLKCIKENFDEYEIEENHINVYVW